MTIFSSKKSAPIVAVAIGALLLSGCSSNNVKEREPQAVTVAGVTVKADPEAASLLPKEFSKGIRTVTDGPFPPFTTQKDNGELEGFTVDLMNAIAAKLGTTATVQYVSYDGLIPSMLAGKADIVIGGYADTDDREKTMDIVNYLENGLGLIVAAGNPLGLQQPSDLCGHRFSIQRTWSPADYFDTLNEYCKANNLPEAEIIKLPDMPSAVLSVKSGRSDATYVPTYAIPGFVDGSGGALEFVTSPDHPGGESPETAGDMFLKKNHGLAVAWLAGLHSLQKDGTLVKIFEKYSLENGMLDPVAMNFQLKKVPFVDVKK